MSDPIPYKAAKTGVLEPRSVLRGGAISPTFRNLPIPDHDMKIELGAAPTRKQGAPLLRWLQFLDWLNATPAPTVQGACVEGGLSMADIQFGVARGQIKVSRG